MAELTRDLITGSVSVPDLVVAPAFEVSYGGVVKSSSTGSIELPVTVGGIIWATATGTVAGVSAFVNRLMTG